jgi:hypothetical protein
MENDNEYDKICRLIEISWKINGLILSITITILRYLVVHFFYNGIEDRT